MEVKAEQVAQEHGADVQKWVKGYLKSVGRTDLIDDSIQEVWLVVIRKLHKYDQSRPIKPWLRVVVVNACKEFLKKTLRVEHRTVNKSSYSDWEYDLKASAKDEHSNGPQYSVDMDKVCIAAEQILDPFNWNIVQDHVFQGLTFRNISQKHGLSHMAIYKRYKKAIRQLKEELDK